MSRVNQILAVLLILQLVLVAVVLWPRSPAVASGEALFPGLEADQIAEVAIRDPAVGQIRMARAGSGWVLPNAGDFPVKDEEISDLLDKLVNLKADRIVAETRASHKRLKVADDDYSREVTFTLADGASHTFYLGTSPSYSVSHLRIVGRDEVYLVSGLTPTTAGVRASNWVDTQYMSLEQDQVVAVTLENAYGQFAFAKDEAGAWTMADLAEGETLQESAVTSLVSRVSTLRMVTPLGVDAQPDYRMDTPNATIAVQTRDAEGTTQTVTLVVGVQSGEDNSYVVKSSTSPYYVQVAEYTMQEWVDKTRDGFLEAPPEE